MRVLGRKTLPAIILACVAGLPGVGFSTVVRELSFEDLCTMANIVFSGTVTEASSYQVPHGPIVTEYAFDGLRIAKGSHEQRQLTLRIMGGTLPGSSVHSQVLGMSRLKVGVRYVVFAEDDLGSSANSFLPILGLQQGLFSVDVDGASAGCVVDGSGRRVIGVDAGRLVVEVKPDDSTQSETVGGSFSYQDSPHTAWSPEDSLARKRMSEKVREQRLDLERENARRRALPLSPYSDSLTIAKQSTVRLPPPTNGPQTVVVPSSGAPCITEEAFLQQVLARGRR